MNLNNLNVKKYFLCRYCKFIVNDPYEKECCGELICKDCTTFYQEINEYCYKCDKILKLRKNIFAKRILNHLSIQCIYDCGLTAQYEEMKKHVKLCNKRIYYCINCDFTGELDVFMSHFIEKHSKEFINMYDFNKKHNKEMIKGNKHNINAIDIELLK